MRRQFEVSKAAPPVSIGDRRFIKNRTGSASEANSLPKPLMYPELLASPSDLARFVDGSEADIAPTQ